MRSRESFPGLSASAQKPEQLFPDMISSTKEPSFFTSFSYSYRHSLDTQGARSAMSWIPPTRAAGRPPPCVPAEPESATRALPILSLHAVVLLTTVYFNIYLACVPYKGTTCCSTLRQPSDTIKIGRIRVWACVSSNCREQKIFPTKTVCWLA